MANGWLTPSEMRTIPLAGTLPDFGNFRISTLDGKPVSYDSYRGVDELMPLATGVSLKPKVWDDAGQE